MTLQPIQREYATQLIDAMNYRYASNQDQLHCRWLSKVLALFASSEGGLTQAASTFVAVVNQASQLYKNEEWIEEELLFEARAAAIGDRQSYLYYMFDSNLKNEETLDLYQKRIERHITA